MIIIGMAMVSIFFLGVYCGRLLERKKMYKLLHKDNNTENIKQW